MRFTIASVVSTARDTRFELLRIVAMFLIVSCHFVAHIDWNLENAGGSTQAIAYTIDQYGGQIGVCIFFILSGYFLINKPFRIQRILRTVLQTLVYAMLMFVISFVVPLVGLFPRPMSIVREIYLSALPVFNGTYWFITSYVFLLLFSPFINTTFHYMSKGDISRMLVLLPFLGIMATFALGPLMWTNLTYAITAYIYGAYIRLYGSTIQIAKRLNMFVEAILIVVSFTVMSIFYYILDIFTDSKQFIQSAHHITGTFPILAILSVSGIFLILHNSGSSRHALRTSPRFSNIFSRPAKYVFGVYLIHENPCIKDTLWNTVSSITPFPQSGIMMISIGVICILILYVLLLFVAFVIDSILVHPLESLMIPALSRYFQ
ncbi:acyltransferase [Bifidobacterium sp. MA2]|uniref:Acyltransferase n=1 Tax=Bifidobacterium santillanense TaxID=2809028 RepID=A0ABS5UQP7_9BIFI|nr:acyltransferase [Bifidobacterium santillanense]MBT1173164.1 acyltransferase [Bifidobacterium santillanense]